MLSGVRVTPLHRSAAGLPMEVEGGDALVIKARGIPGVPVRWVARIELAEVEF